MISQELEICLNFAINEAQKYGHEYVTVEHILYALLHDSASERIIKGCGGSVDTARRDLVKFFKDHLENNSLQNSATPMPSVGFQRVLKRAAEHILSAGKNKIHGDSVLVAIFGERDSFAAYFLEKQNISRFDVVNFISHGVSRAPAGAAASDDSAHFLPSSPSEKPREDAPPKQQKAAESTDILALYAENLCEKVRQGKVDPFVGRGIELERAVQVLCRRRKNNPLFVGDAGVGKTSLVEGLAQRVVKGDVPEHLLGAEIFSIDLGGIIAGTKFRGEFEDRLKRVLTAVKKIPKAVLFIDEIHTVIGAGAVNGSAMDAASILKPMLSNGEIRCIGSTTYKEYRQYFESDHAMSRRFQRINVDEPSVDDSIAILKGIKGHYEAHHKVRYTNEAVRGAVELSDRYLRDRKLPDKAIDVLDEVGASFVAKRKKRLKEGATHQVVSLADVKELIAKIARVPQSRLTMSDRSALRNFGADLKKVVFGQDQAVDALESVIRLARSGLAQDDKPIGSFLFSGPTGVGKTELAKQLSVLMGVEFIRFDMSEYMERHTVSRLIGAPPGYVGYDEGGLLTDAVHKQPHAVLLLDEIEKAHPDIHNLLLQVMDRGVLTDANGRQTDFRNIVLIMTTNVGAAEMSRGNIGFNRSASADMAGKESLAIKSAFSPEFRNRLNGIISFGYLPEEVVLRVVDKFFAEFAKKLVKKRVKIELTDAGKKQLAKEGYDPVYGARPLTRVIENRVKKPVADAILFGSLANGGSVIVDFVDGELKIIFGA